MLRLTQYILALVVWLAFFFNIERLHVNKTELFNIATPVYVLAFILIMLGLLIPQKYPSSEWAMLLIGMLAFVAVKLLYGRPYWGDAYTYITLLEFGGILITVTLAHRVGRLTADFAETVRALIFSDSSGRVFTATEVDEIVNREMRYARRRNRPLSLLLIEADTQSTQVSLNATAKEIEQLLTRRYSLTALTRMLARDLRKTDFILDQTSQGRLVLMAPDMKREQVGAFMGRLDRHAQKRLGITLRCGAACFPDHGVTYDELLHQAELGLDTKPTEQQNNAALASPAGVEDLAPGDDLFSQPTEERGAAPAPSAGD